MSQRIIIMIKPSETTFYLSPDVGTKIGPYCTWLNRSMLRAYGFLSKEGTLKYHTCCDLCVYGFTKRTAPRSHLQQLAKGGTDLF
jgi:hypothetical protein